MILTLTADASEELQDKYDPQIHKLKLVYDAEGCGCAVSGVPAIWVVGLQGPDDLATEAAPYQLLYEKRHEVFFDDQMKLDFSKEQRKFRLSSPQQIYHSDLKVLNRIHE